MSNNHQFNYLNDLSKGLNKLRKQNKFTDLRIKIEGVRGGSYSCYTHSCVLFASSAVFFKSKLHADNVTEISVRFNIENLQPQHIEEIFNYLYTGDIKLSVNNAKIIYQICGTLELQDLRNQCVECMANSLNIDNCYDFWRFSKKEKLKHLEAKCLTIIENNFKKFWDNNVYYFDEKEVHDMLTKFDKNPVITHADRYVGLSSWFKKNIEKCEIRSCINDFLRRFINFKEINEDLMSQICIDEIMLENTDISKYILYSQANCNTNIK